MLTTLLQLYGLNSYSIYVNTVSGLGNLIFRLLSKTGRKKKKGRFTILCFIMISITIHKVLLHSHSLGLPTYCLSLEVINCSFHNIVDKII